MPGAPGPFDFGFWREVDPTEGFQSDDAAWPTELQDPGCYKRRGQIWNWNDPDQAINGDFQSLKELDNACSVAAGGAFDTTGVHFFNDQHQIYQGIKSIALIRAQEPALRYGRLYFREISEDGDTFGYPTNGHCTLAFSRVLDTDEVLVALNLDASERRDCIAVDRLHRAPR